MKLFSWIFSISCPGCGGRSFRRSRRRPIDQLWRWAGVRPYRCKDCDERFYRFTGKSAPRTQGSQSS